MNQEISNNFKLELAELLKKHNAILNLDFICDYTGTENVLIKAHFFDEKENKVILREQIGTLDLHNNEIVLTSIK
tara:strand:+ start:1205 stop:1429 length:225 start_codon:yes stop_codon:yes gene_type:complete